MKPELSGFEEVPPSLDGKPFGILREMFGFKSYKKRTKAKNRCFKHFYSFSVGEDVLYFGKPAKVVRMDGSSWWDDENFLPEFAIIYEDKVGCLHKISMSPREVSEAVTKL